METKDIIFQLRTKSGLTQDELAEKIFLPDRRYLVGKPVKPCRIQRL